MSPDAALRIGTIGSVILFIIAAYFLIQHSLEKVLLIFGLLYLLAQSEEFS